MDISDARIVGRMAYICMAGQADGRGRRTNAVRQPPTWVGRACLARPGLDQDVLWMKTSYDNNGTAIVIWIYTHIVEWDELVRQGARLEDTYTY